MSRFHFNFKQCKQLKQKICDANNKSFFHALFKEKFSSFHNYFKDTIYSCFSFATASKVKIQQKGRILLVKQWLIVLNVILPHKADHSNGVYKSDSRVFPNFVMNVRQHLLTTARAHCDTQYC